MRAYFERVSNGVQIKFAGDWDDIEIAVAVIKDYVPSDERMYRKETRTWQVDTYWANILTGVFTGRGWTTVWDGETPPSQRPPTQTKPISMTDHFVAILSALPADKRTKARQQLAAAMHPDAGGTNELMTALNVAWEKVK